VRKLVDQNGLPGMKVFQFAFFGDRESVHLPHNYPKNSVAYTGTHDNNTILGYVWELDPITRRRVFDYCGYSGENLDTGATSVIRTVLSSHSDLAILPIQDVLGFGCDTRMNTPGVAKGNWQYRLSGEQLCTLDPAPWRQLNELYGRLSK
jgi:4-alpha-glucanotransferase